MADTCELCESKENIEEHHIRKFADAKNKGLPNASTWVQVMAARNGKALVVCRECHVAIPNGTINHFLEITGESDDAKISSPVLWKDNGKGA